MKVILRSTDLSLIQSARIALDAHDIPTILTDENATGLAASPATLALVDDQDFDRASAVLRDIKQTPRRPWWGSSWAPRALVVMFIVLLLALCGLLIF